MSSVDKSSALDKSSVIDENSVQNIFLALENLFFGNDCLPNENFKILDYDENIVNIIVF